MSFEDMGIPAALIFGLAIVHTFAAGSIRKLAHRYPSGSVLENLFHLLGEVEVVFGLWSGLLFFLMAGRHGFHHAVEYVDSLDFTEPLFVFAIMSIAATRPVVHFAGRLILGISKLLPVPGSAGIYLTTLVVGPLLGSFITEPAAMTVTALILKDRFFLVRHSSRFKYLTLAVLFVNVSIGGAMTPYAAPPILMVASKWGWTLPFMVSRFAWKVALGVIVNAILATVVNYRELYAAHGEEQKKAEKTVPAWLTGVHLAFLGAVVFTAHHPKVFLSFFLFFLGIVVVTQEHQSRVQIREALLVGYFLGGLVFLGRLQRWWIEPAISGLDTLPLFLGTAALTSITDNAALTFLGSQVPNTSEAFRYALVEGAIVGGGLTVIANAPNPAGYSLLQDRFSGGISAGKLFIAALVPTLIAMASLWFL